MKEKHELIINDEYISSIQNFYYFSYYTKHESQLQQTLINYSTVYSILFQLFNQILDFFFLISLLKIQL